MTCHPRESASRNRGTLLCISRNPKRTKADRTSFPERRGTFTRSIQQPLWRCGPILLLRSVPDTDQLPREFPARPPPASCPGTNNFLAINIWPRKIHLPPSPPQLLSSPPHLIPHNPAVKPRHGPIETSTACNPQNLGSGDISEVACAQTPRPNTTFPHSHLHTLQFPISAFRISKFEIPPRPPRAPFGMSSEALAKEEAPLRSGLGA